MSGQLTQEPARTRSRWVPAITQAVLVLVIFAVAGALAAVVWEWLWTPSSGVVVDHEWLQGLAGVQAEFSGTGVYVLVASVAGLLVGVLCALFLDRAELVTLVAVVAGAALAGWIMVQVGHALGPDDPRALARTADNGTRLPSDLRVVGASPYVAFPVGATLSLAVVLLGLTKRHAE
ncbi:hypothetical protein [Nocardioides sp.]|uniref:hypothetical protein n=1 Tax=Nocardioides sp. TaxID=35761 RepID=UPI002D8063DB|nr:hypothetical protein [Nocardioides sp.]HET8959712.1 hypothetical protein [Nocardioides sp.]